MEAKFVINILLLFLVIDCQKPQKENIVHLSFNILEEDISGKYSINKEGERHFYLGSSHFVAQDSINGLANDGLNEIKILTVDEFHELEFEKRRSMIDSVDKKVTILYKDQVFEKIYLYELKEDSSITRFEVKWIEEI